MKEYVHIGALEKEQYEALMKLIEKADKVLALVEKPAKAKAADK